jgi:hypothetical protein
MNTQKTRFLIAVFLALTALTLFSCKRSDVSEPSPLGPSSIGIMMNLEASPNVILVGVKQRQATNITATLKKYDGTGQANRTILFEVVDASGNRLDVGFFEGSTSVFSRTTDSTGSAHVYYYGPLSDEIASDASIYIRGTAAWDGSQFINDTAQIFLVRDSSDLTLTAKAVPDLLSAGSTGGTSVIQATVFSGGQPARNFPVYFVLGMNLGKFSDGKVSTTSNTNDQGVATVTYLGPTDSEMPGSSETVPIFVQVSENLGVQVNILIIRQQ